MGIFEKYLPQKLHRGLTARRIKKLVRAPSLLLKNIKFWWVNEASRERHIFVVGPPRSGTTLVKNVLRGNTKIYSTDGETYFFFRRNYASFRHDAIPDARMKKIIERATSATDLFDRFAKEVKQSPGEQIFLEKTPEHALLIDRIIECFPRAKIIFVVRDPRDGFCSAKRNPRYWHSLPESNPLLAYAETWRRSARSYLELQDYGNLYLQSYEAFCHNPQDSLENLHSFLEIEIQKSQLHPSSYGKTDLGDLKGQRRLRKPITAATVGRWKEELQKEEIDSIEGHIGEEMRILDYNLHSHS